MKLSDAQRAMMQSIDMPGARKGRPVGMLDSGHALRTLASLRRMGLVLPQGTPGPIELTPLGAQELAKLKGA